MRIDELDITVENRIVWRRSGNIIKRGVRCTSGPRKGRAVSSAAQCTKPIDLKKRFKFKQTRSKLGAKMARKARRTKRANPASRRLSMLNK